MTPYSPIRHIAHALFLNHDPKRALMVMLTAYFDASVSQQGTQVITMAGFVSTVDKWVKFEKDWNGLLARYGVPYLHMKEFLHSVGPFETWKGDDEKRKQFIIDFLRVTKQRINKGFSCTVKIDDYKELNKEYRLDQHWGHPYAFVGMGVISRALDWKKKHYPEDKIEYVIEDGDAGSKDLQRLLNELELPYSFTPKKKNQNGITEYVVPFQIADFAAWENQAAVSRFHDGHYDNRDYYDDPLKLLRKSFRALYEQIPGDYGVISKESLKGLCNAENLKRN